MSKFTIVPLRRENEINKLLRIQKRTGGSLKFLFLSIWDEYSNKLVEEMRRKCTYATLRDENVNSNKCIYLVDSFTLPHAFVIFKNRKVPSLVSLNKDLVVKEDYLPYIYKTLDL